MKAGAARLRLHHLAMNGPIRGRGTCRSRSHGQVHSVWHGEACTAPPTRRRQAFGSEPVADVTRGTTYG